MEINKNELDVEFWKECLLLLQRFYKASPATVKECLLQQWIPVGMNYLDKLNYQELHSILGIISELDIAVSDTGITEFLKKFFSVDTLKFIPKDKNTDEILSMYLDMMEFLSVILSNQQLTPNDDFGKSIVSYIKICFTYIILNSDNVQQFNQIVKASKIFKNLKEDQNIPELDTVLKTIIERNLQVQTVEELQALADNCRVGLCKTTTQEHKIKLVYNSIPEKIVKDNSGLQLLYQDRRSNYQRQYPGAYSFFEKVKSIQF